jgi:hypothetical protein
MSFTQVQCGVPISPSNSADDLVNTIAEFFDEAPNVNLYTVVDKKDFAVMLECAKDGHRINFRSTGTDIRVAIDPLGEMGDCLSPETGASNQYSGESIGMSLTESPGTHMHIAVYPDALLVALENAGRTSWSEAVHAGKIYQGHNANDADFGLDGFGMFLRLPRISSSNFINYWVADGNSLGARIKSGPTTWTSGSSPAGIIMTNWTGLVGGLFRLPPLEVRAGAAAAIGYTKYLRHGPDNPFRTTFPSTGTSDQSWVNFTNRWWMMWSKSLTP